MRIECESCHAKYTLADEKVAGRTVTVRCKKCGEKIAVSAAPLTGARQESSVLFSLDNLRSLAAAPVAPSAPTARVAPTPTPAASGEGSGLIDIRKLVEATSAPSASGAKKDAPDLLAGIVSPAPFATLGTPVIAPVPRESRSGVVAGAAIGGVSILAAAAVVIAVLVSHGSGAHAENTRVVAPRPVAPIAAPMPAAPEQVALRAPPPPVAPPILHDTVVADAPRAARHPRHDARTPHDPGTLEPVIAVHPHDPVDPPHDVDHVIGDILGNHPHTQTATPEVTLPQAPSRDQVMSALRAIEPGVRACGQGAHGLATTQVTISGSTGRVTSANVTGSFAGTPVGSCVARAARNAHVPQFRQATFQVTYPFAL